MSDFVPDGVEGLHPVKLKMRCKIGGRLYESGWIVGIDPKVAREFVSKGFAEEIEQHPLPTAPPAPPADRAMPAPSPKFQAPTGKRKG